MKDIIGLGIESSCDETSVVMVKNGNDIIEDMTYSQLEIHQNYGGVVPELASRKHLEKITHLISKCINGNKIDYLAVTVEPGLIGSLLIGYNTAMAVSLSYNIPVIPVNHLEAHLYAILLDKHIIDYPFLGLLVSGGNTVLCLINSLGDISQIGDTLDDACGEALDKVSQLLGLPYPGGPKLEKLALQFNKPIQGKNPFPIILKDQKSNDLNFSFSGIKTSLLYFLQGKDNVDKSEVAYYFQERVFDVIVRNTIKALNHNKVPLVVAAGGVMANNILRSKLSNAIEKYNVKFLTPQPVYCTDNGAMVAALGYCYFMRNSWPKANCISSDSDFTKWKAI